MTTHLKRVKTSLVKLDSVIKVAIINCPECKDPNFDDGACGCGVCKKCGWREACIANANGHYDGDHVRYCDQFSIDVFSNDHLMDPDQMGED